MRLRFRITLMLGLVVVFGALVETSQAQTNFKEFEFDSTKTYVIELLDGTEITDRKSVV